MNETINVIIVVNTKDLEGDTLKVYMVSDHPGDESEGSSELKIVAKVGDYIHWRAVAVDLGDDVELIDFIKRSGDQCIEKPYLTALGWTTRVVAPGIEDYTFAFSIEGHGIFTWDPRIIIIP